LAATEEFRGAQQIESASAFDGSPTLLTPFAAPVGEEVAAKRASVVHNTYDAKTFAVRPGISIRRALGLGVLLALIGVVTFIIVSRRNREVPFETITTTRLTSTGQSVKAAISPDGRYIAH